MRTHNPSAYDRYVLGIADKYENPFEDEGVTLRDDYLAAPQAAAGVQ